MKSNWFHRFLHLRFYLVINTFVPNLCLFDDLLKLLWENARRTYTILFWPTWAKFMTDGRFANCGQNLLLTDLDFI